MQRVAVVVAFLGLAAATWSFTPDDTYIALRYAQNLPHIGLNPGEVYEGYSCPLWVVILHGSASPAFAKAISLLAATGAVIAWPILAAIPWMPMHGVSGMETALATLLAGAAAVCYRRGRWSCAAIAALGLTLCRPEAALLSPLLLRHKPARVGVLALYFAPAAVYWVARWAYFGNFLPAPVWAKLHGEPIFNFGYRYFIPAAAAFAARFPIKPKTAALALLLTLPLTLRAIHKANLYTEALEAEAARVAGLGVSEWSTDTPGLIAYRYGIRVADETGIAARKQPQMED